MRQLPFSKHSLGLAIIALAFGLLNLAWTQWLPGIVLVVIAFLQIGGSWWVRDPDRPEAPSGPVPHGTGALAFTGMIAVGLTITVYGIAGLISSAGSDARILATTQLVVVYVAWLGARLYLHKLG
ncbi:hypothetical protein NQ036_03960 [Brevibacterium sp. 91QC2O2]|uniref:hypothetical protein n=1 Tax=Brevibacterium sp. 91QC2O2 TaxID=2968458 RepID=UPI00211CEB07|nr:hypothetical protein [Brevibacterium sp. 91QC2O2]MCQ9367403.1 hypothetical protein [Brevibacterium sp. 91QC2O2]